MQLVFLPAFNALYILVKIWYDEKSWKIFNFSPELNKTRIQTSVSLCDSVMWSYRMCIVFYIGYGYVCINTSIVVVFSKSMCDTRMKFTTYEVFGSAIGNVNG
jgi:hypothetical protein